jgi:hypothetical protein
MDKLNIREQIQEDIITCCEPYDHVTDGLVTKLCQIVCDRLPKSAVLINTDEVDWSMLREQKEYLVNTNYFWESEYTDGVIHFIDFIQDEASTVLGEEVVFGREPSPSPEPTNPSESSWQPIETAPTDGTMILVSSTDQGVCCVEWDCIAEAFPMSPLVCGFYFPYSEQGECGGAVMVDNPTHWMPLPTPPENI